jgi:hypothetical protein
MATTLDLTKLNKPNKPLIVQKTGTNNPPNIPGTNAELFFDEGVLIQDSVNCCFFKSDDVFAKSTTIQLADYRLGYTMLPQGMHYINYGGLANFAIPADLDDVYDSKKTKRPLFTSIIFEFSEPKTGLKTTDDLVSFHICDDHRQMPPDFNFFLPNPCGKTNTSSKEFHLFYYIGELFLPESNVAIKGRFFMIPLIFSEGLVIYYVIQRDETGNNLHLNKLKTMALLSTKAKLWGVKGDPRYNEHLTIMTCTEIEASF